MNKNNWKMFLKKIIRKGNCWIWTGNKNDKGYGRFSLNGKPDRAHRIAWRHYHGAIPKKMVIDHICRVRSCVFPGHMEVVSLKENILRGAGITAVYVKRIYCKRGHKLGGENIVTGSLNRQCYKCVLLSGVRRDHAKR